MVRRELRSDQWERIKDLLPGKAGDVGRTAQDNRLFIDAVLWIARTGSHWRFLPFHANQSRFCSGRPRRILNAALCGKRISK